MQPEKDSILNKLNKEQIRPDNRMRFDIDGFKKTFLDIDNRLIIPLTCLVMALAYFTLTLSFNASRMEIWGQADNILYWIGIIGMYIPAFAVMLSGKVTWQDALIVIVVLGVLLYLSKVAYSPSALRFVDEQQQIRSAINAFESNSLFAQNPILEISPYYPGLQNGVVSIAGMAHLPVDVAGLILIGVVRVMLMVGLFSIFMGITGDVQISGLASIIYMTNPGFLTFSSYLVYQSLALPAIIVIVAALLRWTTSPLNHRPGLMAVAITSILVTIMTHHVSSYMLVLYLVSFSVVMWLLQQSERVPALNTFLHRTGQLFFGWRRDEDLQITRTSDGDIYTWLTGLTLISIIMWVIFVAVLTIQYLQPQFTGIANEVRVFFEPELASQLDQGVAIRYDENGEILEFETQPLPPLESLIGIGTIVITVFSVLGGIVLALRRWKLQADLFALVIIAGAFYLFVALRFVSVRGGEILSRTWPFTYIALALFMTMLILFAMRRRNFRWFWRPLTIGLFIYLIAGNLIIGWPPFWGRLPGPYLSGAFDRSVDNLALDTTDWVSEHVPPDSRFATDFTMHHLIGGYTDQTPVYGIYELFASPIIGDYHRGIAEQNNIEYLLVDLRIPTGISPVSFYYAPWEYGSYPVGEPIAEEWLTKFDSIPEYDKLYSNGYYTIYDIRAGSGINDQ